MDILELIRALLSLVGWGLSTIISFILALFGFLFDMMFELLRAVLGLFPEGGSLPSPDFISFADSPTGAGLAVIATLVNLAALSALLAWVVAVESAINLVGGIRWLWGWIKW